MNTHTSNPKAKIVVLGTAHELQGKHFKMAIDDECYRDIVDRLIRTHHIDTIFEEASGHSPSDAQEIADSRSPKLSYFDIDPSREEREKHNLSGETGVSTPLDLHTEPPCIEQLKYVTKHAARERFWIQRVREHKFESALFICGTSHTLSVSFRLVDAGYAVEHCVTHQPYAKLCRHVPAP